MSHLKSSRIAVVARVAVAFATVGVASAAHLSCKARTDHPADQSEIKTVGIKDYKDKTFYIKASESYFNPWAMGDSSPYSIYECAKGQSFEDCSKTVTPRTVGAAKFMEQLRFFAQARRQSGGYQALNASELTKLNEIGHRMSMAARHASVFMFDEATFSKKMAPYGKEVLEALQLGFLDEYTYQENFIKLSWDGNECDTRAQSKDGQIVGVYSTCYKDTGATSHFCSINWQPSWPSSSASIMVDVTGLQSQHPSHKNFSRHMDWVRDEAFKSASLDTLLPDFNEAISLYCRTDYTKVLDESWTAGDDFKHPNLKAGQCQTHLHGDAYGTKDNDSKYRAMTCYTGNFDSQCQAGVHFNDDLSFWFGELERNDYETDANGIRVQKIVVDQKLTPTAQGMKVPAFWNNAYAEIARVCPKLTQ